ncbi:unnamed protein product [Effrenium voratum]|uniref:Cyclin N-terminal domain-containing protein n=1 Tax=Effrenium voratum TaxID=2562239 RepID=A0AA36JBX0_9DINO|nr:unnamed protein product [Effrenium voratum]CAJ1402822.1 unnamed protein product [Effrenium voratum]CAJ1457137.1 unnamed protein product [Effrenium voratum]
MARVPEASVRSAAHFNLTASLAAAQPQVRRNAVLGDITNTAPNFGAGVKLLEKPNLLGLGQLQNFKTCSNAGVGAATASLSRSFRSREDALIVGPGGATVAHARENARFLRPASGDFMDVGEDDPMDVEDPQNVGEYVKDIYSHMLSVEAIFQPRPHYISQQREINAKMRAILVDWLVEVHMKYRLRKETLFMAVNLVDRFLSLRQVARKRLQLCGVAAMFIAAKFEEIYPPEVKEFVYITDNAYTKDDILHMEVSILRALNFELCGPTPAHFLDRFARAGQCSEEHAHLMQYLAELSLLEVQMLQYTPSHVAAAAALLSNKLLKCPTWPTCMAQISKHSEAEVKACAREMCGVLETMERSSLQAIRKKYSQERFSKIAKITFGS